MVIKRLKNAEFFIYRLSLLKNEHFMKFYSSVNLYTFYVYFIIFYDYFLLKNVNFIFSLFYQYFDEQNFC